MEVDIEESTRDLNRKVEAHKQAEEELIKPRHSESRRFWYWKNPNITNKYYPCYADRQKDGTFITKNKEVHKDLAEKEIYNKHKEDFFNKYYPNCVFNDLIVHHIDKNIDNFDLNNLIIISRTQHNKQLGGINHENIIQGDWKSGIAELQRLGIKAPHIPELKP